MSRLPVIAVVGRPNIGKSTLVNRIIGRREAVVEEASGVTRDRREFLGEWIGTEFMILDTGGWEVKGDDLSMGISAQAEAAISMADAVIFVVDATTALTDDDEGISKLVRSSPIPVLLAANKIDGDRHEDLLFQYWGLGLGEPFPISALHGRGMGELLDALVAVLPTDLEGEENEKADIPRLAIIGRPNVGKSTLLNLLLGEERVLVSPISGTTRDPIDVVIKLDGQPYHLIDTAGIRRAPRVDDNAEFFAVRRAKKVMEKSDLAILMIDAVDGVTHQDQRLAEEAAGAGCAVIVLLNKWDAISEDERTATEISVPDRLGFIGWAPVLRISAKTGARTHRLHAAIRVALDHYGFRIPTGELNRLFRTWQAAHPPPIRKGRRAKVQYVVQTGVAPPTFVLFTSGGQLGDDYIRFLENRLRDTFDFTGTPLHLLTRRKQIRGKS